jgi:uncharacterized protein
MASLTAEEVLRRYKEEELPEFVEMQLTDVNQVGLFGDRPLNVAATRGIMDEVEALVRAGADVNSSGDLGSTPLHDAVGQGHIEVVKFLLENGASLTATNEFGDTPANAAHLGNREDIVRLLESWAT